MESSDTARRKPHRGIYLLPNLLTTGGMFAGFYAIVAAMAGHPSDAAIAVFVAGLLDGLDGRVARLTNTQSEFGVQYDSLADMVSFGLAPALVLYTWSLSTLKQYGPMAGKLGFAAAFVYAACAALRLARFNTQVGVTDKRYFQGLASPAAAALTMSFVWAAADNGHAGGDRLVQIVAPCIAVLAGLLMVSNLRYFSFKAAPHSSERVPFVAVTAVVLVFVALYIDTPLVSFAIASLYAASGPVLTLWGLRQRRSRRAEGARGEEPPVS
ncbi:CDP-diacylglycerol--serine O-phosphatidyltransferase [Tahibacter soli]|jgi:CDP-diacylglycerol--serine O-phosphatidyltransferase|uniref:CDP-diacylglycerol--serine O-phosphatidyltransferase n=1 Tax=Tahibacter soli TaxID=2983605 RepID=A0A9X3YFV0_9GAMM|nr:CDP-diacylglycerol--serine O-phosphatidyltransferase [Tahibacter soli]MDC8011137.1 CDP-diacylglycerol--serine O-phosphatidyltransferase [Tahibacter soli]